MARNGRRSLGGEAKAMTHAIDRRVGSAFGGDLEQHAAKGPEVEPVPPPHRSRWSADIVPRLSETPMGAIDRVRVLNEKADA
jgi:hypothetical protein